MMFTRKRLLIGIIVILAIVIRFYRLGEFPVHLNWDEVSHGWNAYSILLTGKDEWGVNFPTIFRAFGDYKLPAYIYLTSISEALFGLNEFAVRFVSALAGVGTVVASYFLTRLIIDKKDRNFEYLPYLVAFLVTIEPWSFFVSRFAAEANLASFFVVSGIALLVNGLQKSSNQVLLGSLLLSISVWTYNSARIFVPLFIVSLLIIYREDVLKLWKRKRALLIISIAIFVALVGGMVVQLFSDAGSSRYGWVQIVDEGAILRIIELRQTTNLPSIVSKILYNRYSYFVSEFIKNYVSYFSPDFLFVKGGTHYQFSIPGRGLLFIVNLPLFYIGLINLVRKGLRNKAWRLILVWLLLAPIAGSITKDAPHVLRSLVIIPIPSIIVGLGAYSILETLKKYSIGRIALVTYLASLTLCFVTYILVYQGTYARDYASSWQYGHKDLITYVQSLYNDYDKIIMTKKYGEPHVFALFFGKWNPEYYRSDQNLIRYQQSKWFWVDAFGKYVFINDWEVPSSGSIFTTESGHKVDCESIRCLLILGPESKVNGWGHVRSIKGKGNDKVFEVYENKLN